MALSQHFAVSVFKRNNCNMMSFRNEFVNTLLLSFPRVSVTEFLSRDSRESPEAALREMRTKSSLFEAYLNLCCKETLGNTCLKWLLMLY